MRKFPESSDSCKLERESKVGKMDSGEKNKTYMDKIKKTIRQFELVHYLQGKQGQADTDRIFEEGESFV